MSPEEREVAQQRFATEVRKNHIAAFERDKANALAIGSKQYIWRSCGDGDVCPICKKNDGKRFSWHKAPPHGHPGYCACANDGYCRCNAEPVLPKH
ncbi:phage minor head protein [Cupriavidus sp. USMAA2-4]|uniref:phage minor head protein n=1 Tax=Cupriavidus sp. USMAA2-4 TaxID=876364 RepID=UPI0018DC9908